MKPALILHKAEDLEQAAAELPASEIAMRLLIRILGNLAVRCRQMILLN